MSKKHMLKCLSSWVNKEMLIKIACSQFPIKFLRRMPSIGKGTRHRAYSQIRGTIFDGQHSQYKNKILKTLTLSNFVSFKEFIRNKVIEMHKVLCTKLLLLMLFVI